MKILILTIFLFNLNQLAQATDLVSKKESWCGTPTGERPIKTTAPTAIKYPPF